MPFGSSHRPLLDVLLRALLACACAVALVGCATRPHGREIMPRDTVFYNFGSVQDEEYFVNSVKRLQAAYETHAGVRIWRDYSETPEPARISSLFRYYPLSVRWELSDGRQFLIDSASVEPMMREYFSMNEVVMQWHAEDRARAFADFDPSLVFEVRDDEVIVKWLVRRNNVPLDKRTLALPEVDFFQYPVGAIKGKPASEIDFTKKLEFAK